MAGSTTNIGLIKPTYSEDADVAIINENMDTLDSTISALDNGLAIVSNNNTHGAITAGQYVYVRNHGSLAEGMYTANSNIAANATLSSSNLTAASSGSLNKLNSNLNSLSDQITTLNSKITNLVTVVNWNNVSTNDSGMIVTTLDWSNNYYGGIAIYNGGYYYVRIRPSTTQKVVIHLSNEAGALMNASGVNVSLLKLNI